VFIEIIEEYLKKKKEMLSWFYGWVA
jgi:hypothetical protein